MLEIIFDKGFSTELVVPLDSYQEYVLMNTIHGQKIVPFEEQSAIPDVKNQQFYTMIIQLNDKSISTIKDYNKILNFNINIDTDNEQIIYDINIGFVQ